MRTNRLGRCFFKTSKAVKTAFEVCIKIVQHGGLKAKRISVVRLLKLQVMGVRPQNGTYNPSHYPQRAITAISLADSTVYPSQFLDPIH